MVVTQEELGRRLRAAREACRMKQEDVAKRLEVSRSTVAQMELGNRAVTGLELDRLAYLYGRDIKDFLAGEFRDDEVLVAMFRAHPEISDQGEILEALRICIALGHEITNLERVLGLERGVGPAAAYPPQVLRGKWEAIRHGELVADDERRRLSLGSAPLPNVTELLESQGVRTGQVDLPEDISGLSLTDPQIGAFVVANNEHHVLRRRFSYAHEYCHILLDRSIRGIVSRSSERDDLLEVRANAFAANFLMPAAGVREFVHGLGKGHPSRLQAEVFDGNGVVRANARSKPGSQAIQMYDVVQLAHHFGVSRVAALFRLRNLRMISEEELDQFRSKEEAGVGREVAEILDLPELDHVAARNEFRRRFLGLGLEAFRRGEITRRKLVELAAMVEVSSSELDRLIRDTNLDDDGEGVEALLPES